jgi:dihydropteroate synthase
MNSSVSSQAVSTEALKTLDDQYSNRFIALDPAGYFLIYLDRPAGLICAKHFTNTINDKGLACDPETGKPLPCNQELQRSHSQVFTGRTAKELCIKIFEEAQPCPIGFLDHAAYLGREFVRAEIALLTGEEYVQD